MIIGVTGNMGSGKTYLMEQIAKKGYMVIYSDEIVARAYEDQIVIGKIKKIFSDFDILEEENISKEKIKKIVFLEGNKELLGRLENILHSYVINEILEHKKIKKDEIIFIEIPLLFEKNLVYLVDKIILVVASENIQFKRIEKRDKIDKDMIRDILAKQLPVSIKESQSDYIIRSDEAYKNYSDEIDEIIRGLKEE